MGTTDQLVARESPEYQEFVRLFRLARTLRPATVDRWSGNLWATQAEVWGGFDPNTGDLRLSEPMVLRHLAGSSPTTPDRKAQALATVLHEATHASMETDAPDERNAVRSPLTRGLMEGIAEIRAMEDFDAFALRAGYRDLPMPAPTYPGAHAAAANLLDQCTGPRMSREAMVDLTTRGPAALHFDQLADGVVQNRLAEVVPQGDRQAARAALITTMAHPMWPTLPGRPADAGRVTSEEIRRSLNSKVDEIRHHYRANPQQPFPADSPNQYAVRSAADRQPASLQQTPTPTEPDQTMRFLSGQAPAADATRTGLPLGDGARGVDIRGGAGRAGRQTGSAWTSGPDRGSR